MKVRKGWRHPLKRILSVLGISAAILTLYIFFARPYQLSLGATKLEVNRPMPGDDLRANSDFLATRAITIDGSPSDIWPWLIQMGYGRAGFYGYDILENIGSPKGILSAEEILPELQNFSEGDALPISGLVSTFIVEVEQNEYIVWSNNRGEAPTTLTWALYPEEDNKTRLVSRIGWSYHFTEPKVLVLEIFTEFADHLAVREILRGIKARVEGGERSFLWQSLEFGFYVLTWIAYVVTLLFVLIQPTTFKLIIGSFAAGVVWLISWYAPVPVWVGFILSAFVLIWLIRIRWSGPGTLAE